jgi:anti-sigma factor RsiW
MSCRRMESRLIAFMDGRANDSERRAVQSHLKDCAACRARVEGFEGVWNMLGELPAHGPSEAFDARLRARLAAEPARPSFWAGILPSPRLALAVTVIAVFSLWLSSRPVPNVPQSSPNAAESEFRMIQDLQVLENYDVLASLDVHSQLPVDRAPVNRQN